MLLPETNQLLLRHQQRLQDADQHYQRNHQYLLHLPTTTLATEIRRFFDRLPRRSARSNRQPSVERGQLKLGTE